MKYNFADLVEENIITSKKKAIQRYVAANKTPRKELCPDVSICYNLKDKTILRNLLTGKAEEIIPISDVQTIRHKETSFWSVWGSTNHIIISPSKTITAKYARRLPISKFGVEGIELAIISINGNRKGEEKKTWSYTNNRYFLFKDSKVVYGVDGCPVFTEGQLYSKGFVSFLNTNKKQPNGFANKEIEAFCEENITTERDVVTKPVWGYYSSYTNFGFYFFMNWYKDFTPINVEPKDEHYNLIVSLPEINQEELKNKAPMFPYKVKNIYNDDYHEEWKDIVYIFSIINPQTAIIREFRGNYSRTGHEEVYRFLITNKGQLKVYTHHYYWSKDWKLVNNNNFLCGDDERCYTFGFEAVKDFPAFGRVFGMKIDYVCCNQVTSALIGLKHPIIEKLVKAGYDNIARTLAASFPYVNSSFINNFDINNYSPKSKKNIFQTFGLNRKQLISIERMNSTISLNIQKSTGNTLSNMKLILGVNSLSSLSDKDWEYYFKSFNYITQVTPWIGAYIYKIDDQGIIHTVKKANTKPVTRVNIAYDYIPDKTDLNKFLKMVNNFNRWTLKALEEDRVLGRRDSACYESIYLTFVRLFKDSMTMFLDMSTANRPNIDLYEINSASELSRTHDVLVELTNRDNLAKKKEENDRLTKQMEKLTKERKEKFEEKGVDYSIVIPEHINEVVEEGIILHHCVGSYSHSCANGDTNILFLRNNTDIDKPFYTIEVKNDKIIQIHGKYNEWLGNNPETIPFMVQWIRNKKLKCNSKLLLCTSKGYSSSNNCLDGKVYGLEENKNV